MAETIRHEHVDRDSGSGLGFLLGTLLVIGLLALLFFWGLPALRGGGGNAPQQGTTPGVNINMPQQGPQAPGN